jgi:hypothetical protein
LQQEEAMLMDLHDSCHSNSKMEEIQHHNTNSNNFVNKKKNNTNSQKGKIETFMFLKLNSRLTAIEAWISIL